MDLRAGQLLSHYRLVDKIGQGSMGIVWKAVDTKLDRAVALKLLSPEATDNPERLVRFQREAKAIAALSHPNIVTLHSIEHVGSIRFMTMELVEGRTLAEIIPSGGLALDRLLDIARAITDALAVAHAQGIIHRDLKPANIVIGDDGRTKVLDFGLAKLCGEDVDGTIGHAATQMTQSGRVLGTIPYMSPEQARGAAIDRRSDIFSFGVILYEMATGRRPFQGATIADVLSSILRDAPTPLAALRPDAPKELRDAIGRCLAKDPADRWPSVEAVRECLEASTERSAPSRTWSWRGALLVGGGAFAALALVGLLWMRPIPTGSARAWNGAGTVRQTSVAVLPFANMSAEEDEYFSDGITEELINTLACVPELRVPARTSVFSLRARNLSVAEIGSRLTVETVLEGAVRKSGNRVRVTARLVRAADGFPIWSEVYQRTVEDIFAVQEQISRAIVSSLKVQLADGPRGLRTVVPTRDAEAHDLYLRGRYLWNKRTEEDLKKSLGYFQAALGRDPGFALAQVGLADAYFVLASWGLLPGEEGCAGARAAAEAALRLDESLAEAHTSLAAVRMDCELDWTGAERGYRRALELKPGYATAHQWFAVLLAATGRHEEALDAIRKAHEIDPLSPIIAANVGRHLFFAGRYEEAVDELSRTLELEPGFAAAHYYLGLVLEAQGNVAQAVPEFRAGQSNGGHFHAALAHALAGLGQSDEARAILAQLANSGQEAFGDRALVHIALGETTTALDLLEQAFRESPTDLLFLRIDPRFAPLHAEPRFAALLRGVGL